MAYNRGDSFPFDFEPNRIPFGSKSREKLSIRSYPIQSERKWKCSFHSVFNQRDRSIRITCSMDIEINQYGASD